MCDYGSLAIARYQSSQGAGLSETSLTSRTCSEDFFVSGSDVVFQLAVASHCVIVYFQVYLTIVM